MKNQMPGCGRIDFSNSESMLRISNTGSEARRRVLKTSYCISRSVFVGLVSACPDAKVSYLFFLFNTISFHITLSQIKIHKSRGGLCQCLVSQICADLFSNQTRMLFAAIYIQKGSGLSGGFVIFL